MFRGQPSPEEPLRGTGEDRGPGPGVREAGPAQAGRCGRHVQPHQPLRAGGRHVALVNKVGSQLQGAPLVGGEGSVASLRPSGFGQSLAVTLKGWCIREYS